MTTVIPLKSIPYYFLTVPNYSEKRKEKIIRVFENIVPPLIEVNPVTSITNRLISTASGYLRMLELGINAQVINTPFRPFVCLEDDVNLFRNEGIPENIEIPVDTDLLYIGLSKFGIGINQKNDIQGIEHAIRYTEKENFPHLVKVYNMLALHGVIVCSYKGAMLLQKSLIETFYNNTFCDVVIAQLQPFYNIYALKDPLVFQDGNYNTSATKFSIHDLSSERYKWNPQQDYMVRSFCSHITINPQTNRWVQE